MLFRMQRSFIIWEQPKSDASKANDCKFVDGGGCP
jgi:hypothetical protein